MSMVVPPEDGYGFVASIGTPKLKNGGTGSRMGRHRMANRPDGYPRRTWNSCTERLIIHMIGVHKEKARYGGLWQIGPGSQVNAQTHI